MARTTISVSLPAALIARAEAAVRAGRAHSRSAYVAAALEEQIKRDDLEKMLDEMLAVNGGPLTSAEIIAADAALGVMDGRP